MKCFRSLLLRQLSALKFMVSSHANLFSSHGNDNTLWDTMGACIRGLTRRFASQSGAERPMEVDIAELHNIWFIFTLAISNIDADHPSQDRLVRLILWARETGIVTMVREDTVKAVTISDGKIWTDLPFLVEDVRNAWEEAISSTDHLDPAKACNLAAGIARLAGLGICNEAFTVCGLDIMRRALEEPETGIFTLPQLLAMVEVWLRYGGDKLFVLAGQDQSFCTRWNGTSSSSLGSLATNAGLQTDGLSQERFLFWEQQLLKLKSHEDEETAALAKRCYDMIGWCCLCLYGKGIEAWAVVGKSGV
jgi:hypothetical protein